MALIENPLSKLTITEEEDDLQLVDLEEDSGHQSNYSKLSTCGSGKRNYTSRVPDPKMYLAQSLANLSRSHPGKVRMIKFFISKVEHTIQQQLSSPAASSLRAAIQSVGLIR